MNFRKISKTLINIYVKISYNNNLPILFVLPLVKYLLLKYTNNIRSVYSKHVFTENYTHFN